MPRTSNLSLALSPDLRRGARRSSRRALAVVVGWLCVTWRVFAHDPGLSTAEGRIEPDGMTFLVSFAPADARLLVAKNANAPASDPAEAAWREAATAWLTVRRSDGAVVSATHVRVDRRSQDAVKFEYFFPLSMPAEISIEARGFARLPPAHRQFAAVAGESGDAVAKKFLTAADPTLTVKLSPVSDAHEPDHAGAKSSFGSFVWLGVEHIWTGYDHLLFLLALLIVCRSFRSIFAIISCFTVAHSVTLALATLDLVNLPSRLVEPAIAASIVFVAVENLVRRGAEPRGRWILTFAFGLVHGFGFASVLRELGVGGMAGGAVAPLLGFNLGVELGQIVVAGIALPLVWRLRRSDVFVRRGVPTLSAIIGAAGLYWLIERVIG